MTTSRPRILLGVVLGVALAATAVWLSIQLLNGTPTSPAAQPPPPAPTPTETTASPAFTREGAVEGLRIIVRKRQEALNTVDASILETIYTANCRLANGKACLKSDQIILDDLKRKNQHLQGYPIRIKQVTVTSWEPRGRTAVMRLVYEALPARFVDSTGSVVETEPGARIVTDQVNLVWDGTRWRQAFIGLAKGT
jgi:hypothetical protein